MVGSDRVQTCADVIYGWSLGLACYTLFYRKKEDLVHNGRHVSDLQYIKYLQMYNICNAFIALHKVRSKVGLQAWRNVRGISNNY